MNGSGQALLWSGAVAAALVAGLAGWRERRRKRRVDPDAVGVIAWPTVQLLALIVTVVCVSMALKGQ